MITSLNEALRSCIGFQFVGMAPACCLEISMVIAPAFTSIIQLHLLLKCMAFRWFQQLQTDQPCCLSVLDCDMAQASDASDGW